MNIKALMQYRPNNAKYFNKFKIIKKILNKVGFDNLADDYLYGNDSEYGVIAKNKIPDRWVKTTCGYCSVGCGIKIGVKDGKAISVRGDLTHKSNYGKLCPKGLSEHYSLYSKNRALHPMLRHKNKFNRLSWQEAINVMVQSIGEIQDKHGNDSFAVLSTGQLVTEEFYTLGKLVQLGLKTKNYDGNTTLCMASAVSGYKISFGSDGPPCTYEDFALSDCIFLIGANIADNHPILTSWLNENQDKNIIVADPRVTKTATMADHYLPLEPRSDLVLLNGLANLLIKNNLYNKKYVNSFTDGFNKYKVELERYTPEFVAQRTGLSIEQLIKTTRLIAKSGSTLFAWTMGVNHSDQSTATVVAINNLSLLLGQIGKAGSGPFSITGQCNAMGSRETSFTSSMPGYRKFTSTRDRKDLAKILNLPVKEIPSERGLAYPDIIEAIIQDKIKGLWIIGTNPFVSYPNQKFLQDAIERLDFLVVQDGYYNTPTTDRADLLLPAAIWGEKEGCYTNSERRVSKVNKAVNPPGEALSDFDIFIKVAEALSVKDRLFKNWHSVADAFDEIKLVTKGRLCDYSGLDYNLIEASGGVQWPFTLQDKSKRHLKNNPTRRASRLYADGKFEHANKKAKLIANHPIEPPEQTSKDFPFILNTGRTVEHWHTRTKTGDIKILQKLSPHAWVEINPLDATRLKVSTSDFVQLSSRRGTIKKISVRVTESVKNGHLFMPFHWQEANANNLTINAFDKTSREPNYKQCAVSVHSGKL